ncbi:hypothetical protein SAMN02745857_02665 [Andreprevotia lacus DSM 23236]|jgi:hypothetical protein|uniref:Uncharacterized protein n=1 Tax=Andreprevotia lacus DSM 23236 TaxID=1121001 RepID=A0A1W1XSX6_9NEIS|nr:hypothetical protein [Andreprevotia lacus]SMC26952.1 hypothetical protein SAMN02745857_02665 [Andreprevotia lacus DSM 23236]
MEGVIYRKTQSGLDEMITRANGLSVKLRQLLIQIDGLKPVSALVTPLSGRELVQGLMSLEWDGLIEKIGTVPVAPATGKASEHAAANGATGADSGLISSSQIERIRQVLQMCNRAHLQGELDDWLDTTLPRANTELALNSCLDFWNMRMQERGQAANARTYMQQITAILQKN